MFLRSTHTVFIALLILAIAVGCNKNTSTIGAGLITTAEFDVSEVDTVQVITSTMKFDSIPSSLGSRLLVGYHVDEKLGPLLCSNAFQVVPPSGLKLDPTTAQYRGLSLYLKRDGYTYYDTTQAMTIYAYRLIKPINFYSGLKYNIDSYQIDRSHPLGSVTFYPRPHDKDSIEIYLPDELGKQLMVMAQQSDEAIISSDNFTKFLYGFALVPDSTQSRTIVGLQPSPVMRLYYHDYTVLPFQNPEKFVSFIIGGTSLFYNRFENDLSKTKIKPLKKLTDQVSTRVTDNEMYLQAGTGVAMRMTMPGLKNLNFIHANFVSTRALLKLTPIRSSTLDPLTPPPTAISLDLLNGSNQTLSSGYLTAPLATDAFGFQSYTVDVTSFINGEINTNLINESNALLVRVVDANFRSTINRLYVGSPQNAEFGLSLKIYYLTLVQ